jgi:L-amino acid N-acyltransferase YncA
MSSAVCIRTASTADAAVLREIYRPFVEISVAVAGWSWLVAETGGRLVGYAYGSAHRPREAYWSSVETSAYVHHDYFRQGIGRALYTRLLEELRERGFGSAFAGITLPNPASVRFHESLGFERIGVFPRVGRKFGAGMS